MKEKIWRYCEEGKEERYTLKALEEYLTLSVLLSFLVLVWRNEFQKVFNLTV